MFGLGISKMTKAASKILKRRRIKKRKKIKKSSGGLFGGRPSKIKRKKRKTGFLGKKLNKKGKPKKPKKKIAFNGTNDIVRRPGVHADIMKPGTKRRAINKPTKKKSLISTGKGPRPRKKIKPSLLKM